MDFQTRQLFEQLLEDMLTARAAYRNAEDRLAAVLAVPIPQAQEAVTQVVQLAKEVRVAKAKSPSSKLITFAAVLKTIGFSKSPVTPKDLASKIYGEKPSKKQAKRISNALYYLSKSNKIQKDTSNQGWVKVLGE